MIMLEGPDLAGKTTIAEQLHKLLKGSEIVHRGPPQSQDPFEEYLRPLEEAYHRGEYLILDRWHWGELIYGPLLRGGTIMDPIQHEYIEMACMRYGVSRLLFVPPLGELLQRFDSRGDDLVKREQLIHIADMYQHVAIDPAFSVHHFFEMVEPFSLADISYIVAEAMGYRARANMFIDWPSYVGPTRPRVLFVGEKPAESHHGEFRTAFVPYRGTSGYHLIKCLRAVAFRKRATFLFDEDPWASYGFVNAYDGCDDITALWSTLGYPYVVALGRAAYEATGRYNMVRGRAPHPQFARRFHNGKVESYGEALVRAANGEDMSKWKG